MDDKFSYHGLNGAAYISYNNNMGKINRCEWYQEDRHYNIDNLAAIVEYDDRGNIKSAEHLVNNRWS